MGGVVLMVESYSDIVKRQKEISTAKILNPDYDVEVRREQKRIDQANESEKEKVIQEYVDQKVSEGYALNSDGSLSKKVKVKTGKRSGRQTYKITTTTIKVDSEGKITTRTDVDSTKKEFSSDPLVAKASKLEKTLKDINEGKVEASDRAKQSLKTQLSETYELIKNRQKDGSSFVTVPAKVDDGTVYDIKGQGYSVAPALQEKFIADKSKTGQVVLKDQAEGSQFFTVPRTVSPQETVSIPFTIDQSKLPASRVQTFGGTLNLRGEHDFIPRTNAPTPVDNIEMNVLGFIPESTLKPVISGVFVALLSPAKIGGSIAKDPKAFGKRFGAGAVAILKDPFGKLIQEPAETIVNNPFYEAPKLATELFLLHGALKTTQTVVKSVSSVNKYSKLDVRSSAKDVSRFSERADIYLQKNQINAQTTGGSEFVSIPQLTVPVSQFNRNLKYFSEPQIDVPAVRQFDLAGGEIKPPLNPKGKLPLEEVQVHPFESNLLTSESIGKKPLIDSVSSAQSKVVDLPVSKSFNKDTLLGDKIIDLNKPSESAVLPDTSVQTDLGKFGIKDPYAPKVSSVPKGSDSPLIYEKVVPEKPKTVIDNSEHFNFEVTEKPAGKSQSSTSVLETSQVSDAIFDQTFVNKKVLKVGSDYIFDKSTGEYIKRSFDSELVLTPENKILSVDPSTKTVMVLGSSNIEESSLNPKTEIKLETKADSDEIFKVKQEQDLMITNKLSDDQESRSNIKVLQLQQSPQMLEQSQVQTQKSALNFRQAQIQRIKPLRITPLSEQITRPTPLIPKTTSSKQVPSGAGMFSVLVRKKGRFVKVGSGYSDLPTAFNRGKQEVRDTASASFKVVTDLGRTQKLNIGADPTLRLSKKDADIIVQKRKFRISSAGEKTEIQKKGVFVQLTRRRLKKLRKAGNIFG